MAPRAWPQESELAQIRQDIADLTAAWRERRISAARYFGLLPELEEDERRLAAERERWIAKEYGAARKPTRIREEWADLTLAERRAYIEEALSAVLVLPANGQKRWNPDRLQPVWREE
jgi:hypothetical protein